MSSSKFTQILHPLQKDTNFTSKKPKFYTHLRKTRALAQINTKPDLCQLSDAIYAKLSSN